MTSWILRLLSITLATPHRLVACTDLISVFSIFIQVIDHLTLPQSISVSEDEISFLIPTTFPSSWALALILSEFPGSTCLSPAVHAISTLSSPITLMFLIPLFYVSTLPWWFHPIPWITSLFHTPSKVYQEILSSLLQNKSSLATSPVTILILAIWSLAWITTTTS